jgi:hypothetical protein
LPARAVSATIGLLSEETGTYRGEVLTIMSALADIRVDLARIREILEDEGGEEVEEQEGDF